MSTRYPTEPQNQFLEPQVHAALKNPVAGLQFTYNSIPSDRVMWLDDSVPSAAMEFADESVPVAAIEFTDGSVPATAIDTPAYAIARRSTNQTINNNTVTAISFDTQVADTDTMFAPTATTMTINTAGLYHLGAQVVWSTPGTATTKLFAAIRLNGATTLVQDERFTSTTETPSQSLSVVVPLAATNTIDLIVFQTNAAAGTRTVSTLGTHAPRLSATRIGAS